MTGRRRDWIAGVVADLRPVRRLPPAPLQSAVWLGASWVVVVALTLAVAPLRPGVASQLLHFPQFLGETLVGLFAGVALISAAVALGVPRPTPPLRRAGPALLLVAAWLAVLAFGLVHPALQPSMLGKRAACTWEVLLYGLAPLALGLAWLRRAAPLERAGAGALVGAAAGALPALLMQLACMYEPAHALIHHVAPAAALALLGAALGPLVLRRL